MDPCVKVSVLDDNRERVDELKALIDTGSHVSLTSWGYALKREWRIFETNTKLCGIDKQNIKVVGVAYIMVVPEGDKIGTAIKLIVAENPGEELLLGQDFHKKFGIIVHADETGYRLRQKKENGEYGTANYLLRHCLPQEIEAIQMMERKALQKKGEQLIVKEITPMVKLIKSIIPSREYEIMKEKEVKPNMEQY